MFTNKGKGQSDQLPAVPQEFAANNGGRRVAGPSKMMTSIIANGVRIQGTVEAEGAELQVDGEIEGNVRGGSLTIGDTGMVKGDIVAENVMVNGRVEGSVRARKVHLARNAHVLGDVTHQSLSVEMGAVFEGQCRYLQDPLNPNAGPSQTMSAAQIPAPPAQAPLQQPPAQPEAPSASFYADPNERMVSGVIITGSQN
jgi:cytoskeletal protein CcmA (bactofilin family)